MINHLKENFDKRLCLGTKYYINGNLKRKI